MSSYLADVSVLPITGAAVNTLTIVPQQTHKNVPDRKVVYLTEKAFQKVSDDFYRVRVRAICSSNRACLLDAPNIGPSRLAHIEGEGDGMKLSVSLSQEKLIPRRVAVELVIETRTGEKSLGFLKECSLLKPEGYKELQQTFMTFLLETKKRMAEQGLYQETAAVK